MQIGALTLFDFAAGLGQVMVDSMNKTGLELNTLEAKLKVHFGSTTRPERMAIEIAKEEAFAVQAPGLEAAVAKAVLMSYSLRNGILTPDQSTPRITLPAR